MSKTVLTKLSPLFHINYFILLRQGLTVLLCLPCNSLCRQVGLKLTDTRVYSSWVLALRQAPLYLANFLNFFRKMLDSMAVSDMPNRPDTPLSSLQAGAGFPELSLAPKYLFQIGNYVLVIFNLAWTMIFQLLKFDRNVCCFIDLFVCFVVSIFFHT